MDKEELSRAIEDTTAARFYPALPSKASALAPLLKTQGLIAPGLDSVLTEFEEQRLPSGIRGANEETDKQPVIVVNPALTADQLFEFYSRNNICEVGFGKETAARILDHPHLIVGALLGEDVVALARATFDGLSAHVMEFSLDLSWQGELDRPRTAPRHVLPLLHVPTHGPFVRLEQLRIQVVSASIAQAR